MTGPIQCLHEHYPGFDVCIHQLFSEDPLEYEDAYEWLTDWHGPPVRRHVQELLVLLKRDLALHHRARVLELLGYTESRQVIESLRRHLRHSDPDVRLWAVLSLQQLDFPETKEMVAQFRARYPEVLGEP